jgi:hypothetical protein
MVSVKPLPLADWRPLMEVKQPRPPSGRTAAFDVVDGARSRHRSAIVDNPSTSRQKITPGLPCCTCGLRLSSISRAEALVRGHPVYGLGGCAAMSRDLQRIVTEPWREIRKRVTYLRNVPPATDEAARAINREMATELVRLADAVLHPPKRMN